MSEIYMVHELDNTNKKGLNETDLKNIAEMREELPRIEEILQKFGTLQKYDGIMWYTGFAWFLKLKGRPYVWLDIEYSDKRFEINAYRSCMDVKKFKEKYPTVSIRDMIVKVDIDFYRYQVCKFTGWVQLKDLYKTLEDFIAFIRPGEYSCDIEEQAEEE